MAITETRQGKGFPDWSIVTGEDRQFGWYDPETITELSLIVDGHETRLAVNDRTRRVIRSSWDLMRPVPLSQIDGLVRVHYGVNAYGHTEYYIAER